MITYFCYFGDSEVGSNFKKIIYGNNKLINLLEENKSISLFPLSNILIRYYVNGKITQYDEVENNSYIYDNKKKVFALNFKIDEKKILNMTTIEVFNFIKKTSLSGLDEIANELNISVIEIKNELTKAFNKIVL